MDSSKPLKEGFLQKSHPREGILSITVWQKRYFVLWPGGALEYYSGYSKRADEYCGTVNMEHCEDMVAPTSIGKRRNIIRLTVKQRDKLKDYCLDCECPAVLNEWVACLAEASGLLAENEDEPSFNIHRTHSETQLTSVVPLSRRPLPLPPEGGQCDYEVPASSNEPRRPLSDSMNYEEIGDGEPTLSSDDSSNSSLTKHYSRTNSLLRVQAVQKQKMMMREAIPSSVYDSSDPINTRKPVTAPKPSKSKPPVPPPKNLSPPSVQQRLPSATQFPLPRPMIPNTELHHKINQRRQDIYDQMESKPENDLSEEYEIVEFNDLPEKPGLKSQSNICDSEGYVDVENDGYDSEAYEEYEAEAQPKSPLIPNGRSTSPYPGFLPPKDHRSIPLPLPAKEMPPPLPVKDMPPPPLPVREPSPVRRHETRTHNDRAQNRTTSPRPPLPLPPREDKPDPASSSSPPPLPPPRVTECALPPVPKRSASEKRMPIQTKKRIQPYYTTEIKDKTVELSDDACSPEVPANDRQPVALPPETSVHMKRPVLPHGKQPRPPPPVKPKKPTMTSLNSSSSHMHPPNPLQKPHPSNFDVHSSTRPVSPNSSPSKRPPAILPKPKPTIHRKPLPTAHEDTSIDSKFSNSWSVNSQAVHAVANGSAVSLRSSSTKRVRPLPPPKPH